MTSPAVSSPVSILEHPSPPVLNHPVIPFKSKEITPALPFPAQRSRPEPSISLDNVPLYQRSASESDRHHYYRAYLYPDKIVSVVQPLENIARSSQQKATEVNLSRGIYNGYMSKHTASGVRKFLVAWLTAAEHYKDVMKGQYEINEAYITFATVTLPIQQHHTDKEIKRHILIPFIEKLQRIYNVRHYFWKAEPQQNGNIHFHLILDKYISNKWLQNEWNVSCNALDYLNDYFGETGSLLPPSTDIRKPKEAKNLINYMLKYVTKSPLKLTSIKPGPDGREVKPVMVAEMKKWQGSEKYYIYRKIKGRIWGASREVKAARVYAVDESLRVQRIMQIAIATKGNRSFQDNYYDIVYCDTTRLLRRYDSTLHLSYLEHYCNLFNRLYEKEEPEELSNSPPVPVAAPVPIATPVLMQTNLFSNGRNKPGNYINRIKKKTAILEGIT